MPGVVSQIGQNVADNLFEIGKSAVKGTVGAVTDIASETIEEVINASGQTGTTGGKMPEKAKSTAEEDKEREAARRRRLEEVRRDLTNFTERKKQLDAKIAEEKEAEKQQKEQKEAVKTQERDSWIKKMINRAQTSTEKGRMAE